MILRRNPSICLLIAFLLVVSLAGQAVAAFRMACEGTPACCCRNAPAMPDMPGDLADMAGGCCDIPVPQPCDLTGPVSSPAAPFLPTENNSGPVMAAVAMAAPVAVFTPDGAATALVPIRPPTPAGPPVYLLIQSFLC